MELEQTKPTPINLREVEPTNGTKVTVTYVQERWHYEHPNGKWDRESFRALDGYIVRHEEGTVINKANGYFYVFIPTRRSKKTVSFRYNGMQSGGGNLMITSVHPVESQPTVLEQFATIINGYAGTEDWYVVMFPDGSGHVRDEHNDKFIANLPVGLVGEAPPKGSKGFWFTELINKEGAGL